MRVFIHDSPFARSREPRLAGGGGARDGSRWRILDSCPVPGYAAAAAPAAHPQCLPPAGEHLPVLDPEVDRAADHGEENNFEGGLIRIPLRVSFG